MVEVVQGNSAYRAGLQPKDIITGIDGTLIRNSNDLIRALRNYDAGDEAELTYVRSGAEHTVTIELDEKPQQNTTPTASQEPNPAPRGTVPQEGDFDEWFDYFDKFFGDFFGD